jgi:integrase
MASVSKEIKASGASWRVKWRTDDGSQRSKSFTRKSDADLWRAKVEAGVAVLEKISPVTLSEAVQRHGETRRVSRATIAKERSLSRRLQPLAGRRVATLKVADVRAFVADQLDDGLSAATTAAVLRHLRAVLAQAVEDGVVGVNVATVVKVPTTIKPRLDEGDVWTVAEVERVLTVIEPRYRALVCFRAYCGVRLSEALAVTARDVDLLRSRVHVGHRVLEEVAGKAELRESGKTRAADRWVPIPPNVAAALEHHLATYRAGDHGLLFTVPDGSPILLDVLRRRVWDPAIRAAGVKPVTMRNLRHTAITLMLLAGLQPVEIAHRVGHSKPSLLLDVYARFLPREADQVDPYAAMLTRSIAGS